MLLLKKKWRIKNRNKFRLKGIERIQKLTKITRYSEKLSN